MAEMVRCNLLSQSLLDFSLLQGWGASIVDAMTTLVRLEFSSSL
jgi:hypothetical protein